MHANRICSSSEPILQVGLANLAMLTKSKVTTLADALSFAERRQGLTEIGARREEQLGMVRFAGGAIFSSGGLESMTTKYIPVKQSSVPAIVAKPVPENQLFMLHEMEWPCFFFFGFQLGYVLRGLSKLSCFDGGMLANAR